MNNELAQHIVEELVRKGVKECCLAAGSRNAPLFYALVTCDQIKIYNWFEERSAAFFALGRIKATGLPVAVVTTSGTAAAELLPAAMTAHYVSLPLMLVTADRPRRFRMTGAPQTAEQVGLFGCYTEFQRDLAAGEKCDLMKWCARGPAHLNVCFEEPNEFECLKMTQKEYLDPPFLKEALLSSEEGVEEFASFVEESIHPLVVVGGMDPKHREAAVRFLLRLGAPVYAEAFSNIRNDARLESIAIRSIDRLWAASESMGYPIDGVLRIGEIPTARLWRDLEEKKESVKVCSVSEHPFSGLSRAGVCHIELNNFFEKAESIQPYKTYPCQKWIDADQRTYQRMLSLFEEEPEAEPSLVHQLSKRLPRRSRVFLGTSLPIRGWDMAALYEDRGYQIGASRGVNGIDGIISTFLGWCKPEQSNWALVGDLTAMYDLAGPWILPQLGDMDINIVVINNKGGQIFSGMYTHPIFTNPHTIDFKPIADFWKMDYELWTQIPEISRTVKGKRLIELVPDNSATDRFWKKIKKLTY